MAQFLISKGLQDAYNEIVSKNQNTIYVCTDTGNMYLGEKALFEENSFVSASAEGKSVQLTKKNGQVVNLDFSSFASTSEVTTVTNQLSQKITTLENYVGTDSSNGLGKKIADVDEKATTAYEALDDTVRNIGNVNNSMIITPSPIDYGTSVALGVRLSAEPGILTLAEDGLKAELPSETPYTGNNAIKINDHQVNLVINPSDKILSQNATGLLANVGLSYDSEQKRINLTGNDSEIIAYVDATSFVKDGILNTVTLETDPELQDAGTYLHFVFNVDSGKEDIFVNVTSLIDVYTSGNGISIQGKTISVKIDPSTEGFLTSGPSGIKISGVQEAINSVKNTVDFYTVNGKAINTNPTIGGSDILMTNYSKGSSSEAITSSDSINAAMSKLENKIDAATGGVQSITAKDGSILFSSSTGNIQANVVLSNTEGNIITLNADGLYVQPMQWDTF